ncbi:hypothetical protein V8E36_002207 [Tilletia maclaganii]
MIVRHSTQTARALGRSWALVLGRPTRSSASASTSAASSASSVVENELSSLEEFLDEDDSKSATGTRIAAGTDEAIDDAEQETGAENAARWSRSMASTAFVRSANGHIPDIHAALSLARALAFAQVDDAASSSSTSGLSELEPKAGSRASKTRNARGGAASFPGPRQESVLREFTFAKGQEQRQYLGFGSFTFSNPDALAATLRARNSSVTPAKYFVPSLKQTSETLLADPLLSGSGRSMIGLADISSLIGLPRQQIEEVLQSEGGTPTSDEANAANSTEKEGKWVGYKLERRVTRKVSRPKQRNSPASA